VETLNSSVLLSTIYYSGIKSKTVELKREIYDKFDPKKYPKLGFGTGMPPIEFLNYLWIMNNCMPKNIEPNIAKAVKENSKNTVDAEVIVFLNSGIVPLNKDSIQMMVDAALDGKIFNFSLCDGIAFSKTTYKKLGEPNMRDLLAEARKNKVPTVTLTVSNINDSNKTYALDGKDLFWQSGGENHEEKFWHKCEEVLVGDMYEDRSIKH
jgi:hypothetical protein